MAFDRFRDVYLPSSLLSYDVESIPYFSTGITIADGGYEQTNMRWTHPLRRFSVPRAVRTHADVEDLRDHWFITRGPGYVFPFQDPTDFTTAEMLQAGTAATQAFDDQAIGVGDGATTTFQLVKTYNRGGYVYTRQIKVPVVSSVKVGLDGVEQLAGWSVTREGGIITFDVAPTNGQTISAGFNFDVPVRFEGDDAFAQVIASYRVSGFAALVLVETRPC